MGFNLARRDDAFAARGVLRNMPLDAEGVVDEKAITEAGDIIAKHFGTAHPGYAAISAARVNAIATRDAADAIAPANVKIFTARTQVGLAQALESLELPLTKIILNRG